MIGLLTERVLACKWADEPICDGDDDDDDDDNDLLRKPYIHIAGFYLGPSFTCARLRFE